MLEIVQLATRLGRDDPHDSPTPLNFYRYSRLYDLVQDPDENENIAQQNPDVVKILEKRMARFIRKRQTRTGSPNPMLTQGAWAPGAPFKSSRSAYNTLHIGGPKQANKLQAGQS